MAERGPHRTAEPTAAVVGLVTLAWIIAGRLGACARSSPPRPPGRILARGDGPRRPCRHVAARMR
jgi:hypothetical protein